MIKEVSSRRRYAAVLPLCAVVIFEIIIAYYDIPAFDRFCIYLQTAALTALFMVSGNRLRYRATFLVLLFPFNTLLVIHSSFLIGNGNGFNVENLYHILQVNMFAEYFKMAPQTCIIQCITALLATLYPVTAAVIFSDSPLLQKKFGNRSKRFKLFSAGIFFILSAVCFVPLYEGIELLDNLIRSRTVSSFSPEQLAKLGIKYSENNDNDVRATAGKNLVFIILESTERAFLNETVFPGLLPELSKFASRAQSFDNVSIAPRAHGTFGAIYCMFSGLPFTSLQIIRNWVPVYQQSIGGKLSSLPKILRKAGYEQWFLTGHSADFAMMGSFFESQKFDHCFFGYDEDKSNHKLQFALHDSAVFEQAQQVFNRLAAKKHPFNITILTYDAHGPNGAYKEGEPRYPGRKSKFTPLYDAMYASDHALGKFLRAISSHPAAANTCIVIVSDHLAHHNSLATPLLKKFPRRNLLFLISNSMEKHHNSEVPAMTFDIAPTVLRALGVKHNYRFPMGEDLYSPTTPGRLLNSREQMQAVLWYLRQKSSDFEKLPIRIAIHESYCPKLIAGNSKFVINDKMPSRDQIEIFLLKITADRILQQPFFHRISSLEQFNKLTADNAEYLFFTSNNSVLAKYFTLPHDSGYLLGMKLNGKSVVKQNDSAEKLEFTAQEVADMLKLQQL